MKKPSLFLLTAALLIPGVLTSHAGQHRLRYEWSDSPGGPFAVIPRENMRVHADGTATIDSGEARKFFQVQFEDDVTGSGASVPVQPVTTLPRATVEMVQQLMAAVAGDGTAEGAAWAGARIAPFYTPVTSVWNENGEPDLAELKIEGTCDAAPDGIFPNAEGARHSSDRGFILVSLSRKSPPVIGYATTGRTPCESLLANCQEKRVHRIRRFGPMFMAAEDEAGELLGNEGLLPVLYPDQAYEQALRPVNYSWDSEERKNPPLPEPPPRTEPLEFNSYRELLAARSIIPCIRIRQEQRAELIEFEWQAMEGTAPSLNVGVGEHKPFLEGEQFDAAVIDDEEGRGALATVERAVPGVTITGIEPGAHRLTVYPVNGNPRRYMVVVNSGGAVPRGGGATGAFTTSKMWETTGGSDGQPRFDQRSDLNRWCAAVGCGPTMLAMQIAWAEHNQEVPSAYWHRNSGASLTARRLSLRQINSPLTYQEGSPAGSMLYWYDYLHDACNVACWPHNGSGSALPWDVGGALGNYVDFTCSLFMPLTVAGDAGGPLVGGNWQWTNDGWGDDWDDAGVRVANAIKAGRPAGVYYMEHWHYCMAWRYRKTVTQVKVNGNVISTGIARLFRVNTGWGNADRVWNAYDIDGCFLMNLWQKRELP